MTKRVALLVVLIGVLAGGASPAPARAAAPSAVTPWIDLELTAIGSHRLNPPRASRALAHVSSAMYLAARSGRGARDDAVAGAASTVLAYFFPDEREQIAELASEVAHANSPAFRRGSLIGRRLVGRAERDGADEGWTGTPPEGLGFWVATPPGFGLPLEPLAGTWRTWNLRNGSAFRPGPPPAYGSAEFRAELDEVYAVSKTLTDEQRRVATFWADGAGTATPAGHWNLIALDLVGAAGWSTLRTARLFAALNTAQADAFIACWDAKYAYWSLRPMTAIRRLIDPIWLSYIPTPPFPSYVSGHSTTSGAASTVLSAFLPDQAARLNWLAEDAAVSRLFGGIHYRSDNEVGLSLGRRVGRAAVRAFRGGSH